MKNLNLIRPLAVIDTETTGVDPLRDRIVVIAIEFHQPNGEIVKIKRKLNPGVPIPQGATAIHGITDADVQNAPSFKDIGEKLAKLLSKCDLAGYNIHWYDLKILRAEFARAGIPFDLTGINVIDACAIFHVQEPRTLQAAVKFYLQKEHTGAHNAEFDAAATAEIMDAQLERYGLPNSVAALAALFPDTKAVPNTLDIAGNFIMENGEIIFAFGKHKGRLLSDIAKNERKYLLWMGKEDFPEDTLAIVAGVL